MNPISLRRHLHRHPELSFREEQTARFLTERLAEEGIASRPIARTGVLATLTGRTPHRRAVVLRADIDALPVQEQADTAWRSENRGVMHACGHDMHAAILFGVLQRLKRRDDFAGTVFGLFQPGEECNPGGASLVLAEGPFAGYDVAGVVGEHVDPELEVGEFGFRAGKYMAANDELRFTLHGRGGHAALRDRIDDTVRAAARLTVALTDLNTPERIVSIGRMEADGATNVIPDCVRLEGTMRTFDEALRQRTREEIDTLCRTIGRDEGVRIEADIDRGYPCVVNDPALTRLAQSIAAARYRTIDLALRPTAEDFGFYGLHYPALFYRLGAGAASGRLHTPGFNPDERAIATGIDFMEELALKILAQ